MPRRTIKATLRAEDRASPTFNKVAGAVKALGIISAAVGAIQIGRLLVRGLNDAVQASAKYESAAIRLAVALAKEVSFLYNPRIGASQQTDYDRRNDWIWVCALRSAGF